MSNPSCIVFESVVRVNWLFPTREHNDNAIVFDTFRAAVKANPDAHPLFHSDRGFQYTSHAFHHMLEDAGMTQSMSRVAHCIDNGPMEGFWGILKREEYYGSWQKKSCFFIVLLTGSGSKKVGSRVFVLCFRCKKTFRTLLTKLLE